MAQEVNFDGLVGPTHNYAGLSFGNRASAENAGAVASPQRAALQGIAKMRRLLALGVPQGVLPPPMRPDPLVLAALGVGSLAEAAKVSPELVAPLMSASAMWAANAATVSPSADTADGRIHFTPANLVSTSHRALEPAATVHILRTVFGDRHRFEVHAPLPSAPALADEGAANHGRITPTHGEKATHLFVFGREAGESSLAGGFPRRQSRLAGELIAAQHGLDPARVVHARQSAAAIDAGAFHNDVVSVVNENVLFTHQFAFENSAELYAQLGCRVIEVPDDQVPLADAISSYLFNSQLVSLPDGSMTLVAPIETAETPSTAAYLDAAVADADNPIASMQTMDLRESMRNGGGPACLRLRVVMTEAEMAAVAGRAVVDDSTLDDLEDWVRRHYRPELAPADLLDPALPSEVRAALVELEELLELPGLYRQG